MNRKAICLIVLLLSILSCKKDSNQPDSGTSQLWLKVDQSVPDFTMTLKCADLKNTVRNYTIIWAKQTLNPNLKKVEVGSNDSSDSWVQVYKAFDRTEEITIELSNGKVYKTKGFEYKEKRVIEVVSTIPGSVNVIDRDISIIEKIIWVD
jgi:hypothetical protein